MKIICFLRDAGISISSIEELLSEENPGMVISVLIEQQEKQLAEELTERQNQLTMLEQIRKELKSMEHFSVESIGDIAYAMENKKNMQKLHAILLFTGFPMAILEWFGIIYGIVTGIWWPCFVYLVLDIPYGIWIFNYYFKRVA